jgi:hypothetical protein
MKKAFRNWRRVFTIGAVALVVVTFLFFRWSQPSYNGKKLKNWLKDFPMAMDAAGNLSYPFYSASQHQAIQEAGHAIQMMGKSALPALNRELHAKENRLDYQLAMIFFRWHKYLRYEYDYTSAESRRCRAISAIAELGEESKGFVPELKLMCKDTNESSLVRLHARLALEHLTGEMFSY